MNATKITLKWRNEYGFRGWTAVHSNGLSSEVGSSENDYIEIVTLLRING